MQESVWNYDTKIPDKKELDRDIRRDVCIIGGDWREF